MAMDLETRKNWMDALCQNMNANEGSGDTRLEPICTTRLYANGCNLRII